jgi:cephalosporin hydroxylase
VVTADPAEALQLIQQGRDVVLIVGDETDVPPAARGAGRLALMVGDPSDPATAAAAREMDDELFSSRR